MNGPFLRPTRNPEPALRLFAFHHAGGSASAYFRLMRQLPCSWDPLVYELPGRGRRHRDRLPDEMPAVIDEAVAAMRPWLDRPYGLFGHSMGAVVAFEVAHRLSAEGRSPIWLGLSGRAPSHGGQLDGLAGLDDTALLDWMIGMRGTPVAVRESPEMSGRVARILRADLECLEGHQPPGDRPLLRCPITAIGAIDDELVAGNELPGWSRYTTAAATVVRVPGHHFSLLSDQLATCAHWIRDGVTSALAERGRHAALTAHRARAAISA